MKKSPYMKVCGISYWRNNILLRNRWSKTSGNDKWEVGEWGYDGEMGILLYSYSA